MQKVNYILLFFIVMTTYLHASDRPRWINEAPSGYSNDFYVGIGRSSRSESDARNASVADALQRIVQSGTITLQGSQQVRTESTERFKDGQSISMEAIDKVVSDIRIVGESKTIRGLREEEYYTEEYSGLYTVWSLVKIPKRFPRSEDAPSRFSPVWRSTILPSWGQFYKGESTKGYLIAFSIAALIPGGIIFDNLQTTAQSDAKNSRTQVLRDYYVDQANTYKDLELACYAVAGAIYVYNLVDAIASSGEKVYVDRGEKFFTPLATYSPRGLDVGFQIRF